MFDLIMMLCRGYDSDNPRVTGDVGMAGVAIDSVEDMKVPLSLSLFLDLLIALIALITLITLITLDIV